MLRKVEALMPLSTPVKAFVLTRVCDTAYRIRFGHCPHERMGQPAETDFP